MKILIADDSKAMRTILRKCLRQAGFGHAAITEAESGREAAQKIRQDVPHLILTDWNMADIGGYQLLLWLKKAQYQGKVGVVSSAATREMRTQAMQAGAAFIIIKPFTAADFLNALEGAGFQSQNASISQDGVPRSREFSPAGVESSFVSAFRPEITVKEAPAQTGRGHFIQATYTTNGTPYATVIAEKKLALSLGAALMLIPASRVNDALKGDIPENIRANLNEVFNLLLRLLAPRDGAAAELSDVIYDVVRVPRQDGWESLGVQIDVSGYGEGRMTLMRDA